MAVLRILDVLRMTVPCIPNVSHPLFNPVDVHGPIGALCAVAHGNVLIFARNRRRRRLKKDGGGSPRGVASLPARRAQRVDFENLFAPLPDNFG